MYIYIYQLLASLPELVVVVEALDHIRGAHSAVVCISSTTSKTVEHGIGLSSCQFCYYGANTLPCVHGTSLVSMINDEYLLPFSLQSLVVVMYPCYSCIHVSGP